MVECAAPTSPPAIGACPKKTRAEFRADGFFITGDLGKIVGRGYSGAARTW
jgi:malonyl-CoA/methylmalonyl-CoA synthetase